MGGAAVVLLERENELSRLESLLARSRQGSGAAAVIEGAPGIGKTALIETARRRALTRGFEALMARGSLLERDHPFGVANQLLRSHRVASEPTIPSVGEAPFRALEERFQTLAGLAAWHPLLVCIDDAQWSDLESLRLLDYLCRRVEALAALVLVGTRQQEAGERRQLLATIAAGAIVVRPLPLSTEAAASLLEAGFDTRPDAMFAAACSEVSGGNPFLLTELVLTARGEGLEPSGTNAERVRQMTPEGVIRAVLVRMGQLPDDARNLAAAMAVLGGNALLREAAALVELDPSAATHAAGLLTEASVIAGVEPLEFVHPIVRNAVYADLGISDRQTLHARAARLLDAQPAPPLERVAGQLLALIPAGDPWVAERLTAAGSAAIAGGACDAAASYLRRALAEPPPASERPDLLVALAHAETSAGAPEAVEHLHEALALIGDPAARARVLQSLGRLRFMRGEFADAGEVVRQALDDLDAGDASARTSPLGRRLLADYLAVAFFWPRLRPEDDPRVLALVAEVEAGVLPPEPQLCAQVAGAMALRGMAPALVREVTDAAMRSGPPEDETAQGFARAMLSAALILIGDYDLASTVAEGEVRRARETGSMVARAQASQALANVRWHQGRLLDAVHHAEAARGVSHQGWGFFSTLAVPTLAFAELLLGHHEAAHAAVRVGEQLGPDRPEHALVLFARGRLAMAEGAPERALSDFQAAGHHDLANYGMEHPTWLPWRPFAALAAHAAGSRAIAHELAESGVALARPLGTARPIGHALCAAGQVVGGEEGLTMLMEAVAVLEESQSTLEHANALVALGAALRRSGRVRDARVRLQEGQRIAHLCGADPLVERAREELLAAGAHPRKVLQARAGPLTPTERRVAELAATGSSNREIAGELVMGTRTVEAHLARTYAKFGIRSRRQLAQALASEEKGAAEP